MKNSKIKIVPNEQGTTVRESSNKDIHYVRLQQSSIKVANNFLKKVTLSCLVFGKHDELVETFSSLKFLPGKLVIKETLVPSDERNLKRAGSDDAPICMSGDQPIYRTIIYDPTSSLEDTLIPHTNVDEIREFHNDEEFVPADTEVSEAQA
tara:strand:- start:232 stop:684 length:453 start_codon:yes stop_codon:yes gene_type:complete